MERTNISVDWYLRCTLDIAWILSYRDSDWDYLVFDHSGETRTVSKDDPIWVGKADKYGMGYYLASPLPSSFLPPSLHVRPHHRHHNALFKIIVTSSSTVGNANRYTGLEYCLASQSPIPPPPPFSVLPPSPQSSLTPPSTPPPPPYPSPSRPHIKITAMTYFEIGEASRYEGMA